MLKILNNLLIKKSANSNEEINNQIQIHIKNIQRLIVEIINSVDEFKTKIYQSNLTDEEYTGKFPTRNQDEYRKYGKWSKEIILYEVIINIEKPINEAWKRLMTAIRTKK